MQPASYLEGGPLLWILPLYLHINKKSDDGDDDDRMVSSRGYLTQGTRRGHQCPVDTFLFLVFFVFLQPFQVVFSVHMLSWIQLFKVSLA